MLEVMRRLYSGTLSIQESTLPIPGNNNYWHTIIIGKDGIPISGGFAEGKENSRKIATSEFLERMNFRYIKTSPSLSQEWGLNILPTGCGFAVGYSLENTVIRSLEEACERWAMSKWIDDKFPMNKQNFSEVESSLTEAALYFSKQFDSVEYYNKSIPVMVDNEHVINIEVAATLGIKGEGVFAGYSARAIGERNNWEHALLESYRHLLTVKNNPVLPNIFPDNRIRFFSHNKDVALQQITSDLDKNWPSPKITFQTYKRIEDGNYFIARTIIENWKPWHQGPISRFLY